LRISGTAAVLEKYTVISQEMEMAEDTLRDEKRRGEGKLL